MEVGIALCTYLLALSRYSILMVSWFSSWLPELPTIDFALPSGLQGRFISFVLKKSLGHFLKPGQLDSRQIDTQIGSGYVQVNDVELDNEVRLSCGVLSLSMKLTRHVGYQCFPA